MLMIQENGFSVSRFYLGTVPSSGSVSGSLVMGPGGSGGTMVTSASYWVDTLAAPVSKGSKQLVMTTGVGDTVPGDTIRVGLESGFVQSVSGSTITLRNPLWEPVVADTQVFTGKVDVTLDGLQGVGRGWRFEVQWSTNGQVIGKHIQPFTVTKYSIYTDLTQASLAGSIPEIAKQVQSGWDFEQRKQEAWDMCLDAIASRIEPALMAGAINLTRLHKLAFLMLLCESAGEYNIEKKAALKADFDSEFQRKVSTLETDRNNTGDTSKTEARKVLRLVRTS